jgi:non-specific serine/threonine protein kinase/serine/threonine-protein kinase
MPGEEVQDPGDGGQDTRHSEGAMPPGHATMAELDRLLASASAEVQRGIDEGLGRVGRYALVSVLGEGGFGTVWLASQEEPVRRLVALKLLRRDPSSSVVMARFRAERQALARMDHPNVASVLDAGVAEDGRPWFAMPYIDGPPITRHCDDERLGVRERVALFAEVCDGVQHAHQKGVIHRDIKPGNVLVSLGSGRATPKVIDFGVAKALEPGDGEGARTAEGQRLGTPQYMAPEQWLHGASAADARSDGYALGVLLSELVPEAMRDRDLSAIVARATAHHPDDRYATADALADDLRRWLDGRAVAARRRRNAERIIRAARAHPRTAVAGSVAALVLAVLAVLWGSAALEAEAARGRADAASTSSEQSLQVARAMIAGLVAEEAAAETAEASVATLRRVEALVDRMAVDDPLTAGRLAASVAQAQVAAWDRLGAHRLLMRSLHRVLEADPQGRSLAYRELLEPSYRVLFRLERDVARVIGPDIFGPAAADGRMATREYQTLARIGLTEFAPWPSTVHVDDADVRLGIAAMYASMVPDPEAAAVELALHRVGVLSLKPGHPGAVEEMRAAVRFVAMRLPACDSDRVTAEHHLRMVEMLAGFAGLDQVQAQQLVFERILHVRGRGSAGASRAAFNLACACMASWEPANGFSAFAPYLEDELARTEPGDPWRRWFLSYFCRIAWSACEDDAALALGLQMLAEDVAVGAPPDGMTAQSARVLAAAWAERGDDAAAAAVEGRFGVEREAGGAERPFRFRD